MVLSYKREPQTANLTVRHLSHDSLTFAVRGKCWKTPILRSLYLLYHNRRFDWCKVPSFSPATWFWLVRSSKFRSATWFWLVRSASFSPATRFWLVRSEVLCFAQQRGFDWCSYFIWNWQRVIFYSTLLAEPFFCLLDFCSQGAFIHDLLTACLFKEIDAQICLYIAYKSVLSVRPQLNSFIYVLSVFTQEFSLVVWLLMCDRKTNPKKIGQCRYF